MNTVLASCLLWIVTSTANKAILISSSIGFYNYRQTSNTMKMYHHLKSRGFADQDILLMIPENHKCSLKNSKLGSISFYDGDHTNIGRGVQIDCKFSQMKLKDIYSALVFKYHPYALNSKRIDTDSDTNLFVYFTGHGGDDYFKIRQRQAVLKQHLTQITSYLHDNRLYSKILYMSDSCSSSTIFEDIVAPSIVSLASSSRNQKSLSYGFDMDLNSPKSDGFTYYVDQYFVDEKNNTIKELFGYLDHDKLKVNSKLMSTFKPKQTARLKLQEFLSKSKPAVQTIAFDDPVMERLGLFANFLLS